MQGNLDEFLSAFVGAEEEDDDAGPVIDVGSRAAVSMQAGGAASVAAASIKAADLHVQFRTTQRTLEELNQGVIIARKQDRGLQGSKTYIAIRKAATTPLPNKLLGPRFLGAKNKEGELLNRNKTIQD